MKRIFSFLFAIIALVGTIGVFTSCQEDAPEINYTINITVNNDFTEVVNAINNGTMKQTEAIAALTAAIEKMNGDQAANLQALIESINSLATTLDAKLAIIEAAMKAQTLALETKLDLLTAAVEAQTLKQEEMGELLATAIDNLSGTLEDKLAAIEAIIESTSATMAEKIAAVEAAMKAQTLSLENKLALLEAAIKALPDYTDQLKAIEAAIKGMPDYSDKLAAIETAIKNIPDYSEKMDAIEAAIKNAPDYTEAIQAIKEAIAALPDYTEKLGAIITAIEALPDYSTKLEAIAAAVEAIPDYSEKFEAIQVALEAIADNIEAQEGQYADELEDLTDAIDAITAAVEEGNKSQEDALAEIIALLESSALAGGGSGSGGEGEGGEDEWTYQSITLTTSKAIGETIMVTVQGELAENEVEGADIIESKPFNEVYTDYKFKLTSQKVTIKQASIAYYFFVGNQITKVELDNCTDLSTLYCRNNEITGENMTALVEDLPDRTGKTAGRIIVYGGSNEKNVITKADVAIAKAKNWNVLDWYDNEYEGIELQYITLTTKKAVGEEFQISIEIDGLGALSADERMAILQAAVVDMNITDVAGFSDFYDVKGTLKKSNLKIEIAGSIGRFTCQEMGLTSLDVSHCPELYNIYCPGNDLTELDISKNTKLETLKCGNNILSSLDVSNATELQYLDCRYNSIETLDVSKNLNLERLDCFYNKLTSLDISKNTKLDDVDCYGNQLESLLICSSVADGYLGLGCFKNKLDEAAMTALIEALPTAQQSDAKVWLYDNSDSNELNKLTDAHIAAAKAKGYTVGIRESDASGWETK